MMKLITIFSNMIIPIIFILIIIYGYLNKVEVYDTFIEGAKEGLNVVVDIVPTLIGLMVAVGILRASGALDILTKLVKPFANFIGFPSDAIAISIMKPISSSAATGLFIDILKKYGADSFISRFTAVMLGSTETIFYTMSVYFMSVNIKKTRHTLKGAVIANLVGIFAALYICLIFFKK